MNISAKAFLSSVVLAFILVPKPADAILITGNLSGPDAVATHTFEVPHVRGSQPSRVRVRSLSYGGGEAVSPPTINGGPARTTPVPSGGFDVILGIFDGSNQIAVVDDASVPGTRRDPVTGQLFDSAVDVFLEPGTYTLRVTNFDNFSGSGTSPFHKENYPGFNDVTGTPRSSSYAVEVLTFADIINNSVQGPVEGPGGATAEAVFSLAEKAGIVGSDGTVPKGAAEFGGFDHFNWIQFLDSYKNTKSCREPGLDPLPGGNCPIDRAISEIESKFPHAIADILINALEINVNADDYIWYFDEVLEPGRGEFFIKNTTKTSSLIFFDDPKGFDIGGELVFHTFLAGVISGNNGALFAPPTFKDTAFKWRFIQTESQVGAIDNIQFFQNGFFEPDIGGYVEFLGFLTEEEWMAEMPRLRSLGLDIYGLDVDSPVSVDEPPALLLISMGAVGLSLSRRRKPRMQQP